MEPFAELAVNVKNRKFDKSLVPFFDTGVMWSIDMFSRVNFSPVNGHTPL